MENFFSIMGGMGTLATESFLHLLNERTIANKDQDYLNYILLNHATIPDRTAYILDHQKTDPLPFLLSDIQKQNQLGSAFIVLTCNTAHYFYDELQKASNAPILHMPKEAVKHLKENYSGQKIAFLGTEGSIKAKVYEKELLKEGFDVWYPPKDLQNEVNSLIYHDIKERGFLNETRYFDILKEVIETYQCDAAILGCTELSLMEASVDEHVYPVVDAQSVLVDLTMEKALKLRAPKA